MHIEEVTDRLYLDSVRLATGVVEELKDKDVDHSLLQIDINTKRAILAQYLAKSVILPELMGEKEG